MNDAAQLYYAAQTALIELQKRQERGEVTVDEAVLDEMRDRMDALWFQMTDTERERAKKLAAEQLGGPSDR